MTALDTSKFNKGGLTHYILFDTSLPLDDTLHRVAEVAPAYATSPSFLSIEGVQSPFQLIKVIRLGLSYTRFIKAQALLPFSQQEWALMLQVSTRTLERIKKEKLTLTPSQSEKLVEVTLLFDYGLQVFGSFDTFSTWLGRPNTALGGIVPKSLLDTSQGMKAVEATLARISYGVFA
ncbi:MAG: DUF2384 domain-containing protein [Flavobacteriia bacterium]|nr:DUF2384 domain-containing protein [Flavobacteriia bacterium]